MNYHRCLRIILIMIYIFDYNYSLNIEELKLLNCKVDILEAPIKKGEEPSLPIIHVASKSGQEYSCVLPDVEKEDTSQNISMDEITTDIEKLLKPMQSGPCLTKENGWWTVRVCFGRDIEQYHVKDGKIASYVINLGVYESNGDASDGTDKERFYSQHYVNGTECGYYVNEGTGELRTTEVRLYCEEDVEDYISEVEEPDTCRYVITVRTSRLCSDPRFQPTPSKKAVPCHPLLDEEEYSNYIEKENGI